jgi:hypothetical protein
MAVDLCAQRAGVGIVRLAIEGPTVDEDEELYTVTADGRDVLGLIVRDGCVVVIAWASSGEYRTLGSAKPYPNHRAG